MEINSSSYTAIQHSVQRMGKIAHDVSSLNTIADTANHTESAVNNTAATTLASADAKSPRADASTTYIAQGKLSSRNNVDVNQLMTQQVRIQQDIQANVAVAASTNDVTGRFIDETV